jgi:hypothetical protein
MLSAYLEVRQAVTILAYFGGLHNQECMDLKLEQIIRHADGYTITHKRAKQRSDKKFTTVNVKIVVLNDNSGNLTF